MRPKSAGRGMPCGLRIGLASFCFSGGDGGRRRLRPEGKLVTLKVGATPIPHGDLLQLIKPDLEAQGIGSRLSSSRTT